MFQAKARCFVPVLTLTAALFLAPLASASADTGEALEDVSLLEQVEAQLVLIWDAVEGIWINAGLRMDDNG